MKFDREPVLSVTSVKYYDASNALQTLASSYYRLHQQSETAAELGWDDTTFTTPSLYDRDDAVQITYAVGYATVPATAKRHQAGSVAVLRRLKRPRDGASAAFVHGLAGVM